MVAILNTLAGKNESGPQIRRKLASTQRGSRRYCQRLQMFPSESQSAERLCYVGDVAPPTRIPVNKFTTNDAMRLTALTFVDEHVVKP